MNMRLLSLALTAIVASVAVAFAAVRPLQVAVQGTLAPYSEYLSIAWPEYQPNITVFDVDQDMVDNVLSFNVAVSGGALFQCMQLATHQTKAMNLLVLANHNNASIPIQYTAGVILTLASRDDITVLADLVGKSIGAGQATQISSFLSQWQQMDASGVDLFSNAKMVLIALNNSSALQLLMDGRVDAAFVSATSRYDTDSVKVLNAIPPDANFPYVRSTDLYAGPLVSAIGSLGIDARKDLSIGLLTEQGDDVLYGFSTPGDYSNTRSLMSSLGVIQMPQVECVYFQDVAQIVNCPQGFDKNSNTSCGKCDAGLACLCNVCVRAGKTLSKTSVVAIAFSCAVATLLVAAGFVIVWVHRRRKKQEEFEQLTARARELFGNESAIRISEWLGSGAHADVYRGYWYNREVAFKVSRSFATTFEAEIMTKLVHPNIVATFQYASADGGDAGELWIISEFCNLGSMRSAIVSNLFRRNETDRTVRIMKQVARALKHIHDMGIVHGDLNSNNVLLTRAAGEDRKSDKQVQIVPKIADFGNSRHIGSTLTSANVGTISHMAPELFKPGCARRPAQDMYAFGILLWEVTHQCTHTVNPADVYSVLQEHARPLISDEIDNEQPDLSHLMQRCWSADPADRPTAAQAADALDHDN